MSLPVQPNIDSAHVYILTNLVEATEYGVEDLELRIKLSNLVFQVLQDYNPRLRSVPSLIVVA